ncbi:amino acid ABC transporter permease [Catenuloplanes sp. NPDC051500]|uniref:amino acid ABC transporter permease n=1 Tax=Catenuloplanes sp. NPDC051500 TaxID=3363959 RepID=UPI0037B66C89
MSTNAVLYDHPGPRALVRNRILTVIFGIGLLALFYWIYLKFDEKGQWAPALWKPFLESNTWVNFIIPGLVQTLSAALVAMVLSLTFGMLFAVGRLSDHVWVRIPAGAVVEFFRSVPLLLMIFFIFYGLPYVNGGVPITAFWAVVIGLTLYNGSVLAEAFRAGVNSVPRGQGEAAFGIGMRKNQVMRHILIPQAARAMLPVIVSQLVVLVKDTALGYIVAFPELMQRGVNDLGANRANVVAAAIVVAAIYIVVNSLLTALANYIDRRTSRRGIRVPRGAANPIRAALEQPTVPAGTSV